jgi:hypothetical protein
MQSGHQALHLIVKPSQVRRKSPKFGRVYISFGHHISASIDIAASATRRADYTVSDRLNRVVRRGRGFSGDWHRTVIQRPGSAIPQTTPTDLKKSVQTLAFGSFGRKKQAAKTFRPK